MITSVPGKLFLREIVPRIIALQTTPPLKSAPTEKFPQKVIARTQTNFPKRILRVN